MKIDRSKFLGFCLSMAPLAAIACGGGGGDGTSAGGSDLSGPGTSPPTSGTAASAPSSQPEAGAAADADADAVTVNTTPLTVSTGPCTVDNQAPTVSIPTNKAAEAAINNVLAPLSANPCAAGTLASAQQRFQVTANAQGLLSIRVTEEIVSQGTVIPPAGAVQTFNFDVKNGGKQLQLLDVITGTGFGKELAACATTVTAANADATSADPGSPVDEGAELKCTADLTPDSSIQFEPRWVATKDGLEVEADVAHAQGDFVSSTVAWKDLLTDGLNATVVLDFGKAPQ